MRVRSSFKKNRRSGKTTKMLLKLAKKKINKLLSINLLQLPAISKLRGKPHRRKAKSYLRRDVHQKTFENPYQKKASPAKVLFRLVQTRRYLIAQAALASIVFIWFIVLFVQPTFYLQQVSVSGTEEIQPQDLRVIVNDYFQKRSLFGIKRSHVFFFNEAKVEEVIRERYGLETITFETHWPSKSVEIALKEKSSILVYSVNDQFFTIDKKGTVIRETDLEQLAEKEEVPTIYQFEADLPVIGQQVLTERNIETILQLQSELGKYPFMSIHSFRLKPATKGTVVIPEKLPEQAKRNTIDNSDEIDQNLDQLADSIANAQTVEDKIFEIKSALDSIDIEKLEEGEIERYLEQEKVFEPNDSIIFEELEVYTSNGWSLLLGTEPLRNPDSVNEYLNIFATLSDTLSIEGEVKEYVDLRFPNRVYYR